jgi:repressor of nif and glnA expression
MPPDDYRNEDIRLIILQALREENDYAAHEHQLRAVLRTHGHAVSADAMRGHLAWLDEQGAIVLTGEQVQVATITQRGDDAATGAARIPGIARPRPGA